MSSTPQAGMMHPNHAATFTIRTMILDDVAAVARLVTDCYTFLSQQQGFSSRQLQRLVAERCSEEWVRQTTTLGETYLAESSGEIVGLVRIDGHEIEELWVSPCCHRSGIGSRLFSSAAQLMRQRGYAVLTVHTTGYAIPFYLAMGARIVAKKSCTCGPLEGWTLTYLEKELNPGPTKRPMPGISHE